MIVESPWEKDCNGNKAILKELDRLKINPALSKKIALLKMTDITLISGYFHKRQLLFYPSTWVLFDSSDRLEFLGLYSRELEQNNIKDVFPLACLRKAGWSKDIDITAYKTAKTPEEYIKNYLLTEEHMISQNIFLNYDLALPILTLASEIANYIKHGVRITEKSNQNKSEFEYIKYSFSDGFMDYSFSYTPFKFNSKELENWGLKWREHFDKVEPNKELNPTEKFRVSYSSSFLYYLNKFKPYL
ncbi:MAG: hypothetical protein KME09_18950 [Pleurocapsa minor HA4230-MV1]|jgi:hypothetical protein|nr:hypothetical protein [Pleurocapsa minor HA4230-MV1]